MIRKKIKKGLIFICSLLFLSGLISGWELVRVNSATEDLLRASRGNLELSKDMLEAIQEQNTILMLDIADTSTNRRKEFEKWGEKFQNTIELIKLAFKTNNSTFQKIAEIEKLAAKYNEIIIATNGHKTLEWFVGVYSTTYNKLTSEIREFMVINENRIVDSAKTVEGNAFRASMIGVIALSAGILLVVLFYLMLRSFFLRPVMEIQRSLRLYLDRSLPYEVNIQTKDEISELNASIKTLYERDRHHRQNENI